MSNEKVYITGSIDQSLSEGLYAVSAKEKITYSDALNKTLKDALTQKVQLERAQEGLKNALDDLQKAKAAVGAATAMNDREHAKMQFTKAACDMTIVNSPDLKVGAFYKTVLDGTKTLVLYRENNDKVIWITHPNPELSGDRSLFSVLVKGLSWREVHLNTSYLDMRAIAWAKKFKDDLLAQHNYQETSKELKDTKKLLLEKEKNLSDVQATLLKVETEKNTLVETKSRWHLTDYEHAKKAMTECFSYKVKVTPKELLVGNIYRAIVGDSTLLLCKTSANTGFWLHTPLAPEPIPSIQLYSLPSQWGEISVHDLDKRTQDWFTKFKEIETLKTNLTEELSKSRAENIKLTTEQFAQRVQQEERVAKAGELLKQFQAGSLQPVAPPLSLFSDVHTGKAAASIKEIADAIREKLPPQELQDHLAKAFRDAHVEPAKEEPKPSRTPLMLFTELIIIGCMICGFGLLAFKLPSIIYQNTETAIPSVEKTAVIETMMAPREYRSGEITVDVIFKDDPKNLYTYHVDKELGDRMRATWKANQNKRYKLVTNKDRVKAFYPEDL